MSMQRLLAALSLWAAVLLMVAGAVTGLFGVLPLPPGLLLGGGLFVLGLHVLVAGDLIFSTRVRPFTARAQVSRASLEVHSGMADVAVAASDGFERLAAVRVGPDAHPDFKVEDGVAHLRVSRRLGWLPGTANWQARLANNVLWDVEAHSLVGNLDVDLREIRVETVFLKSDLGGVRVYCPRRGRPLIELEARIGDLEVVLPDNVAARVKLEGGRMANLDLDREIFERVDRETYVTLDADSAATVADITLRIQVGEARVTRA